MRASLMYYCQALMGHETKILETKDKHPQTNNFKHTQTHINVHTNTHIQHKHIHTLRHK